MDDWGTAQFSRSAHYRSRVLERFLTDISTFATALFDCGGQHVSLTTIASANPGKDKIAAGPAQAPEAREIVQRGRLIELSPQDADQLGLSTGNDPTSRSSSVARWHLMSLELESGFCDRLALQLDQQEDTLLTENYLSRIWPILREDCLKEAYASQTGTPPTAGWSLLDKVHIAVFVLDEKGLMYRLNLAARTVLRDGNILRRGKGGIFARNTTSTNEFRSALKILGSEPSAETADKVVFLRDQSNDQRVPLTLERYYHEGKPTRFIVATLPISPSNDRVQTLAKSLGLTASEAKVAALIQRGLSNKDAAALAGLKEQTFNTYAKRVLGKLDVKCRSEMARLLTWQASGGPMQ